MTDFRLTGEGVVASDWIDENDHVNMMWYTHLVDSGTADLMRLIGMDQESAQVSYVAARLATAYRRELRLGDAWKTWSAILGATDRSIICAHRIMSGKAIAARSDVTIVLFDRASRQSVALPERVKASAEAARLGVAESTGT